jgi:hypothetical protein
MSLMELRSFKFCFMDLDSAKNFCPNPDLGLPKIKLCTVTITWKYIMTFNWRFIACDDRERWLR